MSQSCYQSVKQCIIKQTTTIINHQSINIKLSDTPEIFESSQLTETLTDEWYYWLKNSFIIHKLRQTEGTTASRAFLTKPQSLSLNCCCSFWSFFMAKFSDQQNKNKEQKNINRMKKENINRETAELRTTWHCLQWQQCGNYGTMDITNCKAFNKMVCPINWWAFYLSSLSLSPSLTYANIKQSKYSNYSCYLS